MQPRVAYVTDAGGDDPETALALSAFAGAGLEALPVRWDAAVEWSDFDLVLVRRTDAGDRRQVFLKWARAVEDVTLLDNPGVVLARNTDRSQIRDFAIAGVPTVDCVWIEPGDPLDAFTAQIHARQWSRIRVQPNVREPRRPGVVAESAQEAAVIAAELLEHGRTVLAQADMDSHADQCVAVVVLGGRISHCIDSSGSAGGAPEGDLVDLVDHVVERAGGAEQIVQARVEIVRGPDGWLLRDFDATEPNLELLSHPAAAEVLAWVVRKQVTPDARQSFAQ
ncbi:MAG: hypothetical protein MUF33_02485 [Candidatus Nanopelagicales bacterium]|nr:hypothetical protein [Candidatus Nanopelagicales bacterium]